MARWRERHGGEGRKGVRLPPVEFDDAAGADGGEEIAMAEWRDEEWIVDGGETAERRGVEMVVVIVTEQDGIDARERIESEAGSMDAARAGPLDGTRAIGEDGVGEEITGGGLEEESRVPNPSGDDFGGKRSGRRWRRLRCERHVGGPTGGARGEFPAEEVEATAVGEGIEGLIGFPVELDGGRRCHRGVASINTSFSAVQTGERRREDVPCA